MPRSKKKQGYCKEYLHRPKRHPLNKDLELWYDFHFKGFSIQTKYGPAVKTYAQNLIETVSNYYFSHSKVFAFRFDLYFPPLWDQEKRLSEDYFSKFMDSLKSKMEAHKNKLKKSNNSRGIDVEFCRAIEIGKGRGVHIHVLLLLNGNVFISGGDYKDLSKDYLSRKIVSAWGSALFGIGCYRDPYEGFDWNQRTIGWKNKMNIQRVYRIGLLNFGKYWHSSSKDFDVYMLSMRNVINASSYLCKAQSKKFGLGIKPFICSRKKTGDKRL